MRNRLWGKAAPRIVGLAVLAAVAASGLHGQETITSSAVSLSSTPGGRASLEFRLADGSDHALSFEAGAIRLDGRELARYEPNGDLERAWRDFLRERAGRETADLGEALLSWPASAEVAGATGAEALRTAVEALLGVAQPVGALPETTTVIIPGGSELSIAPGGIGLDALTRELERLHGSLAQLGESAARAADRLALIVHDDYAIRSGQTVDGNLALLDGELGVAGTVAGDVLVLDGTLRVEPGGRIEGDLLQVGGEVESLGGLLAGELLSIRAAAPASPGARATVEARRAPRARGRSDRRPSRLDRLGHNFGHAMGGLAGTLLWLVGLGAFGLVAVYAARSRVETMAETVRHDFGRAFATGLAGEVLFFPVLLILIVLVITWLVLPFYLLASGLAMLLGYVAVAHAAGEMFAERRYRYEWLERLRRSNSFYYVLSGFVLLLLPFAAVSVLWLLGGLTGFLRGLIQFVACLATWVLVTAGFGSVLLTRVGSRGETAGFGPWATAGEAAGPPPPAEPTDG